MNFILLQSFGDDNYHPNLKLTAIANPEEFLDTSVISTDGIISINVFT